MAVADDDLPRLECGRAVDDVWVGINERPDEHEQSCAHCQAARQSLGRLQVAIDAEHRLPPPADSRPGTEMKAGIMSIVRSEVRQGRRIGLETVPDGPLAAEEPALAITERALGDVIRKVADALPEVRARRVRAEPLTTDGAATDAALPEPATVRILIGVSVRADASVAATAQRLRDRIIDVVAAQVGINVRAVDITVEDLHDG